MKFQARYWISAYETADCSMVGMIMHCEAEVSDAELGCLDSCHQVMHEGFKSFRMPRRGAWLESYSVKAG